MANRRQFLSSLIAASLCPAPSWSDIGGPAYVSAARDANGEYLVCGLSDRGEITFKRNLPARGHAAAPHPHMPLVVAFARRPGLFAQVIDCRCGQRVARLDSSKGRHFYGHGVYSHDGTRLYTTENDYENGVGVVGIWDATQGYQRIGEAPSGGVGPHDIKLFGDGLVIANGGIETHPDSGRAKLNIPMMRPNLSYMSFDGHLTDQINLKPALQRNSIRHLACSKDTVAFAMQWEGDSRETPPLLGSHQKGLEPRLVTPTTQDANEMRNYAGSIALSKNGKQVAITSPRGGLCQVFDLESGMLELKYHLADVCGVAANSTGFTLTTGEGWVHGMASSTEVFRRHHDLSWDNHLIPI